MLTYKDILFSTTNILSNNFDVDIIVDNSEGTFNNECFYVSLVTFPIYINTQTTNKKTLIISVKYFNDSKLRNYEVADRLESIFNRTLKVNNRYLNISNIEPNFLNDEVGNMLDFLITLNYNDDIRKVIEEFENMEDINLEMKG